MAFTLEITLSCVILLLASSISTDGKTEFDITSQGHAHRVRRPSSSGLLRTEVNENVEEDKIHNAPKRRGQLLPPAPARDYEADRAAMSLFHKSQGKGDRSRKAARSKSAQRVVKNWRFRGPAPFPILEDPRLADQEKEEELERIMEKLHYEFLQKKKISHSRLAEARTSFYEALADYRKLTGKQRPENFDYEELPEVSGAAAIQKDEGNHLHATNNNVVLVPDKLPSCLSRCQRGGPICYRDARQWSARTACGCLRAWQACAMTDCSATQRENDGFLIAMNTREQEVCDWPKDKVYQHLEVANHTRAPPSDKTFESNYGLEANSLLDARTRELFKRWRLTPLLEPQGAEDLLENGLKADPAPGATNKPSSVLGDGFYCQVSHPEMIGDGHCDGGLYNMASCNYDGGDCSEVHCRSARHRCGSNGYEAPNNTEIGNGVRRGVVAKTTFKCGAAKLQEFIDFFDGMRDKLALGSAMMSADCSGLNKEEHDNVVQAFNVGVTLSYKSDVQSAAASLGGPYVYIDCEVWDKQMGNPWFGTLISHEMGHSAGYVHPSFKNEGIVWTTSCQNLGDSFCGDHCKEWTTACQTHANYGSKACGFAMTGCQTTCVHKDYCMTLPERLTLCFGYQKVHSRGDSLAGAAKSTFSGVTSMFGMGGADSPSILAPLVLVALVSTLSPTISSQ